MFGKMRNCASVKQWYQNMLDLGIKPNANTHVVMIRGSEWGDILAHNKYLEDNQLLNSISVSVFLDSCGFNNQISVAIEFWKKISSNYPNILSVNTFTSMIE